MRFIRMNFLLNNPDFSGVAVVDSASVVGIGGSGVC
jgi:hypothetical protein